MQAFFRSSSQTVSLEITQNNKTLIKYPFPKETWNAIRKDPACFIEVGTEDHKQFAIIVPAFLQNVHKKFNNHFVWEVNKNVVLYKNTSDFHQQMLNAIRDLLKLQQIDPCNFYIDSKDNLIVINLCLTVIEGKKYFSQAKPNQSAILEACEHVLKQQGFRYIEIFTPKTKSTARSRILKIPLGEAYHLLVVQKLKPAENSAKTEEKSPAPPNTPKNPAAKTPEQKPAKNLVLEIQDENDKSLVSMEISQEECDIFFKDPLNILQITLETQHVIVSPASFRTAQRKNPFHFILHIQNVVSYKSQQAFQLKTISAVVELLKPESAESIDSCNLRPFENVFVLDICLIVTKNEVHHFSPKPNHDAIIDSYQKKLENWGFKESNKIITQAGISPHSVLTISIAEAYNLLLKNPGLPPLLSSLRVPNSLANDRIIYTWSKQPPSIFSLIEEQLDIEDGSIYPAQQTPKPFL